MVLTKVLLLELPLSMIIYFLQILILCFFLNIVFLLLPNFKLRYYASYVNYVMTASVCSVFLLPIYLRPNGKYNVEFTSPFANYTSYILGIRWEVRGEHILQKAEGAVVCVNHQSMFDTLGVTVITPFLGKICAVARRELFYVWPFGLTAWLAGTIFINRNNGKEANKILQETAKSIKTEKIKLITFPEGTRNRQGKTLLPFKRGAFRVAIEAKVPIIPLVYSPYYFIDSEKKLFEKGRIIIKALPPIPTDDLTAKDIDSLMEKTRNLMEADYQTLSKEVYANYKTVKS